MAAQRTYGIARSCEVRGAWKRAIHLTGVRSTSCGVTPIVSSTTRSPTAELLAWFEPTPIAATTWTGSGGLRVFVVPTVGSGRLAHRGRAAGWWCGLLEANINNSGHDLPRTLARRSRCGSPLPGIHDAKNGISALRAPSESVGLGSYRRLDDACTDSHAMVRPGASMLSR